MNIDLDFGLFYQGFFLAVRFLIPAIFVIGIIAGIKYLKRRF